jgi:hypothetical protein
MVDESERSDVLAIGEQLSNLCDKVGAILRGIEMKQISDVKFSLNKPFLLTESGLTEAALMNMLKTYESLRHNVWKITEMSLVDFEILFPKFDINFETYYSVAVSLLNLIYQMQLMRLYCYRLLKS